MENSEPKMKKGEKIEEKNKMNKKPRKIWIKKSTKQEKLL